MFRHPAVWICNLVVVFLSVLSIACYFFAPFWSLNFSFSLTPETITDLIGESADVDAEEIVGDGLDFKLAIEIETTSLIKSFGNDEQSVLDGIVNGNVEKIVSTLTDSLYGVAKKMFQGTADSLVHQQVTDSVRDMLSSKYPDLTDDEIQRKLDSVGITDEYISSCTQGVIDKIYDGGATTKEIEDEVVKVVKDMYGKMENGSDSDLRDMKFTEEDEAKIRQNVQDTVAELADENGYVDPDELLARLILQAIDAGSEGDSSKREIALIAAEEGQQGTSVEQLHDAVAEMILGYIPEDVVSYVVLALRVLSIILLVSWLAWIYVDIKILVKLLKRSKQPTVKLKCPIWFGWLPYLLLAGLPSLAIWIAKTFLKDMALLPPELMTMIESRGLHFSSSGVIAAIGALVLFGISIFFMVARKKIKRRNAEEEEDEDEEEE